MQKLSESIGDEKLILAMQDLRFLLGRLRYLHCLRMGLAPEAFDLEA